ncbi:MAG: pyrroline-5-carboxylate reductase [Syntrophomonadaceae bacterium]|nr:pyrroline-5-carboxylate reductase [Syntrophomonadaceae bacterium]MDD3023921.1 pyrroline-5-carboxylate reductase [Syntrophomonadaceae bacterium]
MSRIPGIIGCGKMAYALLKGINKSETKLLDGIMVNDTDSGRSNLFQHEFQAVPTEQKELVKSCRLVILAVKPQQVQTVLASTREHWTSDHLLISIAAGITTSTLENELGIHLPVVRVMPNTPCLVGEGISAISGGRHASNADVQLVEKMFNSLGKTLVVDEKYMDAVTAVSGSGPAYIFLVIESMINAALQVGLDVNMARDLVLNTMRGSVSMIEQSGEHPAILREQVCSPAGTTIAGVRQLEENGIRKAFFQAVEKAFLRSIELGKDK